MIAEKSHVKNMRVPGGMLRLMTVDEMKELRRDFATSLGIKCEDKKKLRKNN